MLLRFMLSSSYVATRPKHLKSLLCAGKQRLMQEVHSLGHAVDHRGANQWIVTWAMLSNGMAISAPEGVWEQNQRVNAFMHSRGLMHLGWIRVVSQGGPLTATDIHKQMVCNQQVLSFKDQPRSERGFFSIVGLGAVKYFACQPLAIKLLAPV
jgi:hypothetical protein